MKLYATTTSERASKGQGGNSYLEIKLQVGKERRIIGIIKLQEIEKGNYALDFYKYGQDEGECLALLQDDEQISKEEQKGKSQKGEHIHCEDCKRLGEKACCVCKQVY